MSNERIIPSSQEATKRSPVEKRRLVAGLVAAGTILLGAGVVINALDSDIQNRRYRLELCLEDKTDTEDINLEISENERIMIPKQFMEVAKVCFDEMDQPN